MKKLLLGITSVLCSTQAIAMFCPSGFNQMNFGDSIQQIMQQCGTPETQKTYRMADTHQPQEWNYYVKMDPTQPASVKMIVAFDGNKKVINITVNAQSLASTSLCGRTVSVGDVDKSVKAACGDPAFINQNKTSGDASNAPQTEITEFKYNTTPPITLIFENGKLKERK